MVPAGIRLNAFRRSTIPQKQFIIIIIIIIKLIFFWVLVIPSQNKYPFTNVFWMALLKNLGWKYWQKLVNGGWLATWISTNLMAWFCHVCFMNLNLPNLFWKLNLCSKLTLLWSSNYFNVPISCKVTKPRLLQ